MMRSHRRPIAILLALATLLLVSGLLYMVGMTYLEGRPRDFWDALQWAAETLTTTGYGEEARWRHPLMVAFVIVLQFLGVFLIFLIVPQFLIPILERRFEVRLPQAAPDLKDHVVIYRYGPAVSTLIEEVESTGVPTLVIEDDIEEARRLMDQGKRVIHARIDDQALVRAGLERARSLIANGKDDENAALILAARQLGYEGEILALVEDPIHRKPMVLAGANATYTPRHILGAALAARACDKISPTDAGLQHLGRKLEVGEVRIQSGSKLAGVTLGDAAIGRQMGATVLGQWVGGKLHVRPGASMRLQPGAILVVAGSNESIARLEVMAGGTLSRHRERPFVVAGYGEVGQKVVELLRDAGERLVVISREAGGGIDLAGNVLDHEVLVEAGVEEAQAVILALDTDDATLFATVIVKDLAPDVPVIARVNRAANVERIHHAGAEFALSISQVSGQILARRLLGEEAVAVDAQLKILKVSSRGLEGRHPSDLAIRERTGCSVVGVERGDQLVVEFGEDFAFQPGDMVYICGSSEATREFVGLFPQE